MPKHQDPWTAWPLRSRRRRNERRLRLENLEARVVLSGIPGAGGTLIATAPETATAEPLVAANELAPTTNATVSNDNVYQSSDGVVHVVPPDDGSDVVVRQFIDYRLQPVVEVELSNGWFSFAAESVVALHVQATSDAPQLVVDAAVTKPVLLIEPTAVDAAFAEDLPVDNGDMLLALTDASLTPALAPSPGAGDAAGSAPEGEGPPGGGGVPLLPPLIMDFLATRELDAWMFSGYVLDDKEVEGLTITFGGAIKGHTAVVDADGYFELVLELPPDVRGVATAYTVDTDGLGSNTPRCELY